MIIISILINIINLYDLFCYWYPQHQTQKTKYKSETLNGGKKKMSITKNEYYVVQPLGIRRSVKNEKIHSIRKEVRILMEEHSNPYSQYT